MSPLRLQSSESTVENPTLELKIVSASDVGYIDGTEKIDVYAVVSINGDTGQKKQSAKTPIDYDGGSNPTWNHTVKFSIKEEAARQGLLTVYVKLYSYWLEDEDDLYLGEVKVSVQDLLASNPLPPFTNGSVNNMKPVTYPVKFGGEIMPNAKVSLLYRFKPVPVEDLYPQPSAAPEYLPPFSQTVYTNPDPARSGQTIMYSPQFQSTTTTMKLTLKLVIKSAKNIRNVNVFDDMDVYASVMIREGKEAIKHKTKTPIAYSGFRFPTWDHAVEFSFYEKDLAREDHLVVELMSHRPALGDKHIGEVKVRIQELIDSNPPSPLTNGGVADSMKLVTHKVAHKITGLHGGSGTLSFTYRFLKEQVTISDTSTPQPIIMYIPVPHQSFGSANSIHTTSGYMTTVQPGANVGPSNGLVPIYMPHPYQAHEYQQHLLPQPQLPPQKSQPQPQPQQQLSQPQLDSQSQSQLYQSNGYHQYSQSQPQPQPLPPQQPTQSQAQTQGAQPEAKPQGGSSAALGLGAAVLGRVIGGALLSEMI